MPHPCETHLLKKLKFNTYRNNVAVMYHKYDNSVFHPYYVFKDIPMSMCLIGYLKTEDPCYNATSGMYDFIYPKLDYSDFLKLLGESNLFYEPYTCYSYGRATCESACLKVPTLGSSTVDSMRRLYPKTNANVFNISKMKEFAKKLINSDKFKGEVVDYAYEQVEYYSLENCKKRFMEMIE